MLTWQVAVGGPLRALDERLGRALASSGFPSSAAELLADLGNTAVALPVLLAAMAWAGWRGWRGWREERRGPQEGRRGHQAHREAAGGGPAARRWLPPLAAGFTFAAVPALVVPLKLWLARPGPPRMADGVPDGFYPSGHGAAAAVAYGLAAMLLARGRAPGPGRGRARRLVVPVGVAGVVLGNVGVGVGLVRSGYHWPLDVLGSWCLAGVLLAVWCAGCDRWGPGRGRAHRAPHSGPRRPHWPSVSCRSPAPAGPSPAATGCAGRHGCPRGSSTTG
ncbi:hypothetical protein SSP35_16_00630 [Streptomyces sp. NBRC 110611]|uniref:phosphatase PAP2 family protein n=1 Tax=Streptomyces sp. NBRC 110611 TaxID=1621259 RepID=UPI0008562FD8|nr:phosphatase PAP2 family protein [Streptomyces sp. NBRC 110611]GAU70068.1 hypothetical protein SSP35_16_00630 [Streptomyces sp. NBRC 110611]